jgi:hypothetical protein
MINSGPPEPITGTLRYSAPSDWSTKDDRLLVAMLQVSSTPSFDSPTTVATKLNNDCNDDASLITRPTGVVPTAPSQGDLRFDIRLDYPGVVRGSDRYYRVIYQTLLELGTYRTGASLTINPGTMEYPTVTGLNMYFNENGIRVIEYSLSAPVYTNGHTDVLTLVAVEIRKVGDSSVIQKPSLENPSGQLKVVRLVNSSYKLPPLENRVLEYTSKVYGVTRTGADSILMGRVAAPVISSHQYDVNSAYVQPTITIIGQATTTAVTKSSDPVTVDTGLKYLKLTIDNPTIVDGAVYFNTPVPADLVNEIELQGGTSSAFSSIVFTMSTAITASTTEALFSLPTNHHTSTHYRVRFKSPYYEDSGWKLFTL